MPKRSESALENEDEETILNKKLKTVPDGLLEADKKKECNAESEKNNENSRINFDYVNKTVDSGGADTDKVHSSLKLENYDDKDNQETDVQERTAGAEQDYNNEAVSIDSQTKNVDAVSFELLPQENKVHEISETENQSLSQNEKDSQVDIDNVIEISDSLCDKFVEVGFASTEKLVNVEENDSTMEEKNSTDTELDNENETAASCSKIAKFDLLLEKYADDDSNEEKIEHDRFKSYKNRSLETRSGDMELSELEELLDADLPPEYKKPVGSSFIQRLTDRKKENGDFTELEKTMLDDISGDHFDLLPEGWLQMTHTTGIPVYLHRPTRVCTLARPYFLGSGDIYNHRIPVSAVPCLQYRQAVNKLALSQVEDCTRLIGNLRVPVTKVETADENLRNQSLDIVEIRNYCQKLFLYKKVFIKRNKNVKNKSSMKMMPSNFKNRPSLPAETKLLSFVCFDRDGKGEVIRRREWIMNPSGKSYIAILHEYLQQSLKIQPVYEVKDSAEGEYAATVKLNDEVYGKGTGPSKKEAKLQAAKLTLETLIPELNGKAEEICGINLKKSCNAESSMDSNNIFDEIKITDPRVAEFCARTTEPSPYSMLLTCLRRNCGTVDVDVDYTISSRHNKYNQFTMTVGKHTVTVHCRNKRDGKQKAAQAILQALHPQLKTWGSLVRLYGNKSVKNAKEKKLEEQEITQLQTQAKINSPNYAILNKLNEELEKLYQKRMEMKPVGTLITSDMPKNSAVNLNPLNYS